MPNQLVTGWGGEGRLPCAKGCRPRSPSSMQKAVKSTLPGSFFFVSAVVHAASCSSMGEEDGLFACRDKVELTGLTLLGHTEGAINHRGTVLWDWMVAVVLLVPIKRTGWCCHSDTQNVMNGFPPENQMGTNNKIKEYNSQTRIIVFFSPLYQLCKLKFAHSSIN